MRENLNMQSRCGEYWQLGILHDLLFVEEDLLSFDQSGSQDIIPDLLEMKKPCRTSVTCRL